MKLSEQSSEILNSCCDARFISTFYDLWEAQIKNSSVCDCGSRLLILISSLPQGQNNLCSVGYDLLILQSIMTHVEKEKIVIMLLKCLSVMCKDHINMQKSMYKPQCINIIVQIMRKCLPTPRVEKEMQNLVTVCFGDVKFDDLIINRDHSVPMADLERLAEISDSNIYATCCDQILQSILAQHVPSR